MIIKTAETSDTPKIVDLLRLSLGEGLIKKSKEVWDFKHHDNPFGNSHVLLAIEDEKFVGVRALMKWNWQLGLVKWTAYRAVDTSTHPDYQGKGIFKKLTLQALSDVKAIHETFVFNTPNDKSRPGYLKMGWVIVDAISIAVVPTLLYSIMGLFQKKINSSNIINSERLEELCRNHNERLEKRNVIFTPKSAHYLKWRFEKNPMQDYIVISSYNWYVALYIKKHKFFNELRVTEVIGDESNLYKKEIRCAIAKQALKRNCLIITLANKNLFRISMYGKFGPRLTYKSLTDNVQFNNKALTIESWKYSIGDLELF